MPREYPQWMYGLFVGLSPDQSVTVPIEVHGGEDSVTVQMIASRIRGLVDALRAPVASSDPAEDPLAGEDVDHLGTLIDHLHRVRLVLQGEEERLMQLMQHKGSSLRTIAAHLDVAPQTVANRLRRIDQAAERGLTAAGLDEQEPAETGVTNAVGGDMVGGYQAGTVRGSITFGFRADNA